MIILICSKLTSKKYGKDTSLRVLKSVRLKAKVHCSFCLKEMDLRCLSFSACKHPTDSEMFHCIELVLDNDSNLVERKRYPGENSIAMVAWKMGMKTPEYPDGVFVVA